MSFIMLALVILLDILLYSRRLSTKRGIMKNILRTAILTISVTAITFSPGGLALAFGDNIDSVTDSAQVHNEESSTQTSTHETWARDDKMMFVPTWIDPVSGFLDGTFNMNARFDLGAKQLCVFAYDEEQVSQGQVEAQIDGFQEAKWVKARSCRTFTPEHHQSIGLSSAIDKQILAHPSGVFYYAFNIERWGVEGTDWIWGKIDHHECSYNGDQEPHMSSPCYWGGNVNTGTFLLLRSGDAGTASYLTWAEEWSQDLTQRVSGFEVEIANWEGDEAQQKDIRERLTTAKAISADASNAAILQEQFQELLAKLEKKATDLAQKDPANQPVTPGNPETPVDPTAPTNPETPVKPTTPVDPENPADSVAPVKPTNPSTSDAVSSSGNNHQTQTLTQSEVSATSPEQLAISTASKSAASTVSAQKYNSASNSVSSEAANEQNAQAKTDQWSENSANGDLMVKDQEEIEIPALRAEHEQRRWLFWFGIAIVGLAGLAGWWCNRAFFAKNRQR